MLIVLVLAAIVVAIAHLWSKLAEMEQRLAELTPVPSAVPQAVPTASLAPSLSAADVWRPEPQPQARLNHGIETLLPASNAEREHEAAEPLSEGLPPQDPEEGSLLAEPVPTTSAFEELFGRRLPIWAGGITLAVAGVLIVRYSIEAGLLSPLVRFLSGLLFGTGLIAAAETALRAEARIRDRRVPQSLAGAGIASLYASILVAVNVYGLIEPFAAFLGMAAVTALAMALSLRFGPPSALLGLVGGLAAPALVGAGQPDVPLLTLYLALAVGGLSALSRVQRWAWLGVSALLGGLGWGAILLLGGAIDTASTISIGFYVLLVGVAFPLFALPGAGGSLIRLAGSVAAAAQVAALVATGGFALLNWGLFGLISIAILVLSRRDQALRPLPPVGLGIALLLLGAWTDPAPGQFALVLLATVAIYGSPALAGLWRPFGGMIEAAQIAGVALATTFLASGHFYRADGSVDLALAGVALAAACLPAVSAALGWRNPDRLGDARFALLSSSTALLLAIAAGFAVPAWLLALLVGGLAALLLVLSLSAEDQRVEWSGWAFATASLALLPAAASFGTEVDRLFGVRTYVLLGLPPEMLAGQAFLRWMGIAAVAAWFAWRARLARGRTAAQVAAALLAYGAVSQLAPSNTLPLVPAVALLAAALAGRELAPRTFAPASVTWLSLCAAWACGTMLEWAAAGLAALGGDPLLVGELPEVGDVVRQLLAPAALIAGALCFGGAQASAGQRKFALAVSAALGTVAIHILFKQILAIESDRSFTHLGLAERILWEALIAGTGFAAWRLGARRSAIALWVAALTHFGLFTLLLHNPLWADQAVGTVPILNLLLPSYGLVLGLLWTLGHLEPEWSARYGRPRAILQMLLILLLAFSLLRQVAEGSVLSGPSLSAGEDIARSVLAVLLAIGFLLWGMRTDARNWRIASLMLMLGAVAKVFLLDASVLEALMRIGSFVALGISLIGIGWLYSRSLGNARPLSSLR